MSRERTAASRVSYGAPYRASEAPLAPPVPPVVREHDGVLVVRDDLFPGGTKARYAARLWDGYDEVVFGSPAYGAAQTSLATVAAMLGKRVTIFVAKRKELHPRAKMVRRLGGRVEEVPNGYLVVVQARAREYAESVGARVAPFGLHVLEAEEAIAAAGRAAGVEPDEVWCAAGAGVLARGLAAAFPRARHHAVQVGRALSPPDVAGAAIHVYPREYSETAPAKAPFPADPHYEDKAWEVCMRERGPGKVLFWNVTEPAS